MEIPEDALKMFIDMFQNMGGKLNILENSVPVDQQVEYLEYSRKLRSKKQKKLTEKVFNQYSENLDSIELPIEEKKKILALLALSSEVRAYRLLEQYAQHPDKELVNWSSMALMESRISLESELSDERQIYISSGLGGKSGKMRFYVLITSSTGAPFEDYQRKVIETEFGYILPQNDCEVERLTIHDGYLELVFLLPFAANIRGILEKVVKECNLYGDFLAHTFTVTNVKEFNQDEVNQILTRNVKELKLKRRLR